MAHPRFAEVLITPLGLAVLPELNRRGYSLDNPPPDEVVDQVLTEMKARPAAEAALATAVRRFGGS